MYHGQILFPVEHGCNTGRLCPLIFYMHKRNDASMSEIIRGGGL